MDPRKRYVIKHSPDVAQLEAKADELYKQLGFLQLSRLELLLRTNVFIKLADRLDPAINKSYSGAFLKILTSINNAPWEQAQYAWNRFNANLNTRDGGSLRGLFNDFEKLSNQLKQELEKSSQELLKYIPVLAGVELHKSDGVLWQQANFVNHFMRSLAPLSQVSLQASRPTIEKMLENMQTRIAVLGDSKEIKEIINKKLRELEGEIKVMEAKTTELSRLKQEAKNKVDVFNAEMEKINKNIVKKIESAVVELDTKLHANAASSKDPFLELKELQQKKADLEVAVTALLNPVFYRDAEAKLKHEQPMLLQQLEKLKESKRYLESFHEILNSAGQKTNNIRFMMSPQERTSELFDTLLISFKEFFNRIYPIVPKEEKNFPLDSRVKLKAEFPSQFVFHELVERGFLDKRQTVHFLDNVFNELLRAYQNKPGLLSSAYDTTDDVKKLLPVVICIVFCERIKNAEAFLNIFKDIQEFKIGEYLREIVSDPAEIPWRQHNYFLLMESLKELMGNEKLSPKEILIRMKSEFLEKISAIFPKNIISVSEDMHSQARNDSKESKSSSPPTATNRSAAGTAASPGNTSSAPPALSSVADAKVAPAPALATTGESAPPASMPYHKMKIVIDPPPEQATSNLIGDRVGVIMKSQMSLKNNISIRADVLTNTLQIIFKNDNDLKQTTVKELKLDEGLMWIKPKINLVNALSRAQARTTLVIPALSGLLVESLNRVSSQMAKKLGGEMLSIRFDHKKGNFKAKLTMPDLSAVELGIDVFKQRLEKAGMMIHPKLFEMLTECEAAYLAMPEVKQVKSSTAKIVSTGVSPRSQHYREVGLPKSPTQHPSARTVNATASAAAASPGPAAADVKSGSPTGSTASTVIQSPTSAPTAAPSPSSRPLPPPSRLGRK